MRALYGACGQKAAASGSLGMKRIVARAMGQSYEIVIQRGLLERLGSEVRGRYGDVRVAVVTDEEVAKHYAEAVLQSLASAGLTSGVLTLAPGEGSKSLQTLEQIYSGLSGMEITRSDVLLALGGGVVGDVAGFAAGTFKRGIGLVQVPTTLLACVDSSVGGKTAVNLAEGKNLAGMFYQPGLVAIDPNMLATLSKRQSATGFAEVIKYGAILDARLFHALEAPYEQVDMEQVIHTCCALKAQVVEEDALDKGRRMILNFGHTLGHAIEAAYGFGLFTHGEAISIGMAAMAAYGEERGLTSPGTREAILRLLHWYGLPSACGREKQPSIMEAIRQDKKAGRKLSIVLLERIGQAKIIEVERDEFANAICAYLE